MPNDLDRFWAKVDKTGECWLWTGTKGRRNYGRFTVDGNRIAAHRWLYQQMHGAVADNIQICHVCDNPPCVRPEHLFAGTQFDNMKDAARKGRIYGQGKTHCKRGHPLCGDNMLHRKDGKKRECRECVRLYQYRYDAKRRGYAARKGGA